MKRGVRQFFLALGLLLAANRLPAQTCPASNPTFSDNTFNDADWELIVFNLGTPGGSATAAQLATDGNPIPSRGINVTSNGPPSPAGSASGAVSFSGNRKAIWSPATQGAILTVDYCEDAKTLPSSLLQATSLALKQGGIVYVGSPGLLTTPASSATGWVTISHSFTANDFADIQNGAFGSRHPDFSASGGAIEFGLYRGNTTGSATYTTRGAVDNWSVTVHAASQGGGSAPIITAIAGGFGFLPVVAPNGLANIIGRNLADTPGFNPGTTRITVNGVQALFQFAQFDANTTIWTVAFQVPPQTQVGPAIFVVNKDGVNSAPFSFQVSQFAPQLAGVGNTPFARMQHADGTTLDANSPASPGEKVKCVVSGLGATDPPVVPTLVVGGFPATVESIRANDPIFGFPGVYGLTFVLPPQLGSGNAPLSISINNLTSTTRNVPIQSKGLSVSQSGVTFRAVAGSTTPLQRIVSVISTSQPITWSASVSTISGGNWLQITPATGISDPARAAPTLQISANTGTLAVGDYYGTVTIRAPNVLLVISVVLSVRPSTQSPGPIAEPTGLVFVGSPGTTALAAKTFRISNPTTTPLTFTSTSTSSSATPWFTFQPATANVPPGAPVTITVQPNAGLAAGNLTGSITLNFSDGSQRVVNLLAVLVTGAVGGSGAFPEISTANCTPTKLFAVFTLLGLNFTSPVAWPSNIDAFVTDDCGTAVTAGAVSVTFSNGDPPLGLLALQDGHWAGTWTPRNPINTNLVVTLKAQVFSPDLQATATLSGAAPANPNVPIVFNGGVVGTASYVASPAPGTLISLFGAELADDLFISSQVPRPNQILTTQVLLGGVNLPLLFVSKGQVNALAPYGLKSNTTYQLIVQRGNAISTPETLAVLDSQPGVFTLDQSGKGQGHIYRATSDGLQILAAPGAAVAAGDVLVVYCSGLGEVDPPSVAGTPARFDVLQNTTNKVTATIGGVNATVQFAGLTPGFTGLYQVNLVVPPGVTPGAAVELVLSSAGQVSKAVTLAVR